MRLSPFIYLFIVLLSILFPCSIRAKTPKFSPVVNTTIVEWIQDGKATSGNQAEYWHLVCLPKGRSRPNDECSLNITKFSCGFDRCDLESHNFDSSEQKSQMEIKAIDFTTGTIHFELRQTLIIPNTGFDYTKFPTVICDAKSWRPGQKPSLSCVSVFSGASYVTRELPKNEFKLPFPLRGR